ncbi:MAG: DUF971 domain-containing protein [Planctomycetota bacterium]|nr:DUF971 domain-containing protein [Planctomycetota bacterium]
MTSPAPLVITKSVPESLTVEWTDGSHTHLSAAALRRICPCAHCVNEHTGVRMLDPDSIPEDLTQSEVILVGNYALRVTFADNHNTGLFTWSFLHEWAQAQGEK